MLKTEFKLEYKIEESPTDGGVPVIVVAAWLVNPYERYKQANRTSLRRAINNKNSYAV